MGQGGEKVKLIWEGRKIKENLETTLLPELEF